MENSSFSYDLQRYWGILRRWLWLLVLVTLVTGALVYMISKRSTPVYQAVTTVLINEAPATKQHGLFLYHHQRTPGADLFTIDDQAAGPGKGHKQSGIGLRC